jgi:predicted helicase
MGGAKANIIDRANVKGVRSIVLTTFAFSKRGVSISHMDAIILLTPRRSDFIQIIGRILRRGSDSSIVRSIIDIVDNATVLKKQFGDRKAAYKAVGFAIKSTETIQYDAIVGVPQHEKLLRELEDDFNTELAKNVAYKGAA